MKANLLEAGEIVNTHGIRGEIKINPWCDTPYFLLDFDEIYIDDVAYTVLSARVHKSCVLMSLSGICDVNAAQALRGKKICIDKNEVDLDEGQHFIADLIGLDVIDVNDGKIGTLHDVLNMPASDVYVIRNGDEEFMIPVVSEFVLGVDMAERKITVRTIPGMRG